MHILKRTALLIILQITAYGLSAQKNQVDNAQMREPVNLTKDKQEYQGYTIRLVPARPMPGTTGSYGFDILKDNKPVVHQFHNPLSSSAKGVQNKDDAYKTAQWMIREYKKQGYWQHTMPAKKAQALNIKTN